MGKPITPTEARTKQVESIPDFIIEIFNTKIVQNLDSNNRSTITQKEIMTAIMNHSECDFIRQKVFDRGWLDIEPLYRTQGWNVTFDKPAYCETYEASWTFKVGK